MSWDRPVQDMWAFQKILKSRFREVLEGPHVRGQVCPMTCGPSWKSKRQHVEQKENAQLQKITKTGKKERKKRSNNQTEKQKARWRKQIEKMREIRRGRHLFNATAHGIGGGERKNTKREREKKNTYRESVKIETERERHRENCNWRIFFRENCSLSVMLLAWKVRVKPQEVYCYCVISGETTLFWVRATTRRSINREKKKMNKTKKRRRRRWRKTKIRKIRTKTKEMQGTCTCKCYYREVNWSVWSEPEAHSCRFCGLSEAYDRHPMARSRPGPPYQSPQARSSVSEPTGTGSKRAEPESKKSFEATVHQLCARCLILEEHIDNKGTGCKHSCDSSKVCLAGCATRFGGRLPTCHSAGQDSGKDSHHLHGSVATPALQGYHRLCYTRWDINCRDSFSRCFCQVPLTSVTGMDRQCLILTASEHLTPTDKKRQFWSGCHKQSTGRDDNLSSYGCGPFKSTNSISHKCSDFNQDAKQESSRSVSFTMSNFRWTQKAITMKVRGKPLWGTLLTPSNTEEEPSLRSGSDIGVRDPDPHLLCCKEKLLDLQMSVNYLGCNDHWSKQPLKSLLTWQCL